MSACGGVIANLNLAASCGPVGGVGSKIYLFNWDEVAVATNDDGDVTAISPRNGCVKGYTAVTRRDANQTNEEGSKVVGAPMYNQTVTIRGAIKGKNPRKALDNLFKADRLLVVVEENGNEADRFKVYGVDNGIAGTTLSLNSNQNAADLSGFELPLGGVDTSLAPYYLPTGLTSNAQQRDALDAITIDRVVAGVNKVLQGVEQYTFRNGGQIIIKGCGFSAGVTNVNIGGRTTNPTTGTTYTSEVTVLDDNTIHITLGSSTAGATSTNGTAVVVTLTDGRVLNYTNPSPITIAFASGL